MPKYKAVLNCTDFDGRFYRQGEIVELPEGKHSDWLVCLDKPAAGLGAVDDVPENSDETPEAADTDPERYTEDTLKPLTKAQLVDLGQEMFGLSLSVRSKEADIIAAILAAQAQEPKADSSEDTSE